MLIELSGGPFDGELRKIPDGCTGYEKAGWSTEYGFITYLWKWTGKVTEKGHYIFEYFGWSK